jgi:hypothetical protein
MARERLRVVVKGDSGPEERGFAEASRALVEEALADGALALVIMWETPDAVRWRAAPASIALAKGLVGLLDEELNQAPAEDVEEA